MEVLYKENTPQFIYFMTLYNVFHDYLDELTEDKIVKSKTGFKETHIWNKLYKFQKDGVMGAIDKIEKYNGCIIADSVGLGKTFTALAIIKYYELRNDRVLVLAPKKLRENWTIYTQNDKRNIFVEDRFNFNVLNHTDLSRISGKSGDIDLATINWSNYDLVVIDESHNFRNNPPVKGRMTRYERLMNDIIKAGVKTKVLMLSATPVNNRMNDIKNQIAFITEGNNSAFSEVGIPSVEMVLKKAQTVFNKWSALDEEERTTEAFTEMMDVDYFKLLDTITIARFRKYIEKYYNVEEIGKFPERLEPLNQYPGIDSLGEFPSIELVNKTIKKLTLCVYSPLGYVLPGKRSEYEKKYDMSVGKGQSVFKQVDREKSLVGLIRVNMLKRMESSIYSFKLTVQKLLMQIKDTLRRYEIMLKMGLDLNLPIDTVHTFIYDSNKLGQVRDFAVNDHISIMIINIDAFRKSFADPEKENKANVIHRTNDKMNGMKPIELIQETNPFVIIDEPQSVDTTPKSKEAIASLNPLCILRYSATYVEKHNLVYKLDAVDSFELGLVKQIEVAGFSAKDNYNTAYIRLISVDNRKMPITAKVEIDINEGGSVKRKAVTIRKGDDLYDASNGRDIYEGYIIDKIYCAKSEEYISFTGNSDIVRLGDCIGEVDELQIKNRQIRKTIEEHLNKELVMHLKGVKVLSLFFIDRVANYRYYDKDGNPQKGIYATMFEENYKELICKPKYKKLIEEDSSIVDEVAAHNGYFSQDKKGVLKNTSGKTKADEDAYVLIMKDKEKLLSFDSKLRFIFSHSALREGWDNPNVFQICTLNETC